MNTPPNREGDRSASTVLITSPKPPQPQEVDIENPYLAALSSHTALVKTVPEVASPYVPGLEGGLSPVMRRIATEVVGTKMFDEIEDFTALSASVMN